MVLMRTTIDLDAQLLNTVRTIAAARNQTLSRALCDLAWKGLQPEPARHRKRNGFPVMRPQPGARTVTAGHVARLMEEMEQAEIQS